MSNPAIFAWLDTSADSDAALADWCRAEGGEPAVASGSFQCWIWPGDAARRVESGGLTGAMIGSIYAGTEPEWPAILASACRDGRLPQLDGRFCVLLHDPGDDRLVLYRDASAAMFLFYRVLDSGALVCSSDLDRIVTCPGSSAAIGRRGLHEYLRMLDISTPNTLYDGVHSPEPGRVLMLDALGNPSHPPAGASAGGAAAEATGASSPEDRIEQLLRSAVAKRLPDDGPILSFLSGGIDSALVTAAAAELAPGRVTAYTVGFEESGFDETPIAAAIASHLGLPHRILRLPLAAYRDAFDELARITAYPIADPAAIPTLIAYRDAQRIAPFALDGTGAEVCVGVTPPRYQRIAVEYAALLPRWARRLGTRILGALGPLAEYRPLLDFHDPEEVLIHWRGWRVPEVARLCGEPVSLAHTRFYQTFAQFGRGEHVERYTALLNTIPDDRIHEINRLLGFELRFPFFDPELAEAIAALPLELRDPPEDPKRILRRLLARRVPREIWDLPKHGFDFPFARFMDLNDHALIRDTLPDERVRAFGLINADLVADTIARYRAGDRSLSFRVWSLVILFAWLEHHWQPLSAAAQRA